MFELKNPFLKLATKINDRLRTSLRRENNFKVSLQIILQLMVALIIYGTKAHADEYVISNSSLDDVIRISTSSEFGGSITSLIFRGKEYIDAADKGRELQSASTFDGLGECYNPTEAGGSYDKHRPSSSKLLFAKAVNGILETETNMAFWRMPGEQQPGGKCGERVDLGAAQNTTLLSNHLLSKRVEIGYCGISNAIHYKVTYKIPKYYSKAKFEAVSLHTPSEFDTAYMYELKKEEFEEINIKQTRVNKPIVLSTRDGNHAIGLYCSNKDSYKENMFYGYKSWPDTSVARCVFLEAPINKSEYSYEGILFVGRINEVLNAIHTYFKSDSCN